MKLTIELHNAEETFGAFMRYPDAMAARVRPAMKEALTLVQADAIATHRYTTRSAMLEHSAQVDVDESGMSGRVVLDPGIAYYAQFIHDGFKSWPPDEFLYQALEKNEDAITELVQSAIDEALKDVGL